MTGRKGGCQPGSGAGRRAEDEPLGSPSRVGACWGCAEPWGARCGVPGDAVPFCRVVLGKKVKKNSVLVPCAPSLLRCTPGVKGKGATRPRVAPPAQHRGARGRRLQGGGPAPAAGRCARRGRLRAAACPPLSNAASAPGKCHTQLGGRFPPLSPRPFPAASAHAASQPCLRTPEAPCPQGDAVPGAARGAGGAS